MKFSKNCFAGKTTFEFVLYCGQNPMRLANLQSSKWPNSTFELFLGAFPEMK